QRGARAQLFHEGVEVREIVAVVGIAHDDVSAARRSNATGKRRAVALLGDVDDAGAGPFRNLLTAVGRAVVGDEHFARYAGAREKVACLADAYGQRLRLVETRHEDGQFEVRSRHESPPARAGREAISSADVLRDA